jgi:hypothetical protein
VLEILAKIAVLADYYELQGAEAIELNIEIWVAALNVKHKVPKKCGWDVLLWLFVA